MPTVETIRQIVTPARSAVKVDTRAANSVWDFGRQVTHDRVVEEPPKRRLQSRPLDPTKVVIDEHIPVPDNRGLHSDLRASIRTLLLTLAVGQSFEIESRFYRTLMSAITDIKKSHPALKFTTRRYPETARVWRFE